MKKKRSHITVDSAINMIFKAVFERRADPYGWLRDDYVIDAAEQFVDAAIREWGDGCVSHLKPTRKIKKGVRK